MDTENNMNPMIILELNQKVKELIAMENIPLLRDFFLKYDMIMQPIDANNLSPLHFAVQLLRKKSLIFLCSITPPQGINAVDIFGRTPLHQAAAKGDLDIILILMKFGADINAKTISGETPLMKAIGFYQVEATKLLLRFGADPNMINNVTGKDCLTQAYECRNNDIINIVKIFKEKYSNIIKMVIKIGSKDYPRKNYLQILPEFLIKKAINYLIP